MPTVYHNTIAHYEIDGEISESGTYDKGLAASVSLRVAWADRQDFIDEVIGTRLLWQRAPASLAECRSATSVPLGDGVTDPSNPALMIYDWAKITLNFEVPPDGGQENGSGDLIAESLEPTVEFLTLDPVDFRWTNATTGDQVQENEAPGQQIRGLDYVVTHYRASAIPAACLTLPGSVNSSTVTANFLGLTFAAETLLYQPPKCDIKIGTDGTEGWTITHRFSWRPNSWNKFWRAKTQAWEYQYHKAGGGSAHKPYPPASFAGLALW